VRCIAHGHYPRLEEDYNLSQMVRQRLNVLSVVLVEDSAVVRERLVDLLDDEPGIEIVGEYADAQSAIDGIANANPDVVLLDIKLAAGSGMQVLNFITQYAPRVKVIVLSNYAEPQYRSRYLAAGALEVLDKSNEFDRVPTLLRALAEREPQ
jgi:DNA-binding NarL/FixJ family response regulator